MRRVAQFFLAALPALAPGEVAARADATWPLRGEVVGEVKIGALAKLGFTWRVESTAEGLTLRAEQPGVALELGLRPGPGEAWRWTLLQGSIDVAELWPRVRGTLGGEAAGWSASGRVDLTGEGTWTPSGGPAGELRLTLREGWARSEERDAELSGIELDLATREFGGATLPAGQSLRIARAGFADTEMREVKVAFGLGAGQVLEVASGEAAFLGGHVRLRPFRVPLAQPAVTAAADVESLQLSEAARLLPWLLQFAQGRLRGRVELTWDKEKGLRVNDGGLTIVRADDASFRLTPSPGLLTGNLPRRIAFLPWPWASWVGVTNPAYGPLKEIEMGREGLRIEEFDVDFWPDGAGRGRTAAIHILGRPTGGKFVKEVKLDLNFHGPWSEFLAFGLNHDLSGISFRLE